MTKTKAKQWLKAVRELRAYYRGDREPDWGCPFCTLVSDEDEGCEDCLWYLFTKYKSCCSYTRKKFERPMPVFLRVSRDPRWVRLSLTRLERWEKRLLGIIND